MTPDVTGMQDQQLAKLEKIKAFSRHYQVDSRCSPRIRDTSGIDLSASGVRRVSARKAGSASGASMHVSRRRAVKV